MGHYRPASETPFEWRFAGRPIMTRDFMLSGISQCCRAVRLECGLIYSNEINHTNTKSIVRFSLYNVINIYHCEFICCGALLCLFVRFSIFPYLNLVNKKCTNRYIANSPTVTVLYLQQCAPQFLVGVSISVRV